MEKVKIENLRVEECYERMETHNYELHTRQILELENRKSDNKIIYNYVAALPKTQKNRNENTEEDFEEKQDSNRGDYYENSSEKEDLKESMTEKK